jgi:hypothetical protein
MKSFLFVLLASLSTASFAGPEMAIDKGCTVYQHANYRGWSLIVPANNEMTYVEDEHNDQISAVRIDRGCQLIAYTDPDLAGQKRVFTRNTPYVGNAWNDKFSSLECLCAQAK